MQRFIIIACAIALGVIACGQNAAASADSLYYYSNGAEIYMQVDTSRLLLKFDGVPPAQGFNYINNLYPEMEFDTIFAEHKGFGLFSIQGNYIYDSILESLASQESVEFLHPVALFDDTIPIFTLDELICMFAPGTAQGLIDSLIDYYHLNIVDTNSVLGNEYVLRVTDETESFIVDVCNDLYGTGFVQFCHPNFLIRIIPDSYQIIDEYYAYQYNIKAAIDYGNYYNDCWEITAEEPRIKVAILDTGIEDHEDLDTNKMLQGYDARDGDTDPSPNDHYEIHGMAVAGAIFARHNNDMPDTINPKGGTYSTVGIAPECSIVPIRILGVGYYEYVDISKLETALLYAYSTGVDILNNSYSLNGGVYDNITNVFDFLYQYGRNGLGAVIVFSAGNGMGALVMNYDSRNTYRPHWPLQPSTKTVIYC